MCVDRVVHGKRKRRVLLCISLSTSIRGMARTLPISVANAVHTSLFPFHPFAPLFSPSPFVVAFLIVPINPFPVMSPGSHREK